MYECSSIRSILMKQIIWLQFCFTLMLKNGRKSKKDHPTPLVLFMIDRNKEKIMTPLPCPASSNLTKKPNVKAYQTLFWGTGLRLSCLPVLKTRGWVIPGDVTKSSPFWEYLRRLKRFNISTLLCEVRPRSRKPKGMKVVSVECTLLAKRCLPSWRPSWRRRRGTRLCDSFVFARRRRSWRTRRELRCWGRRTWRWKYEWQAINRSEGFFSFQCCTLINFFSEEESHKKQLPF